MQRKLSGGRVSAFSLVEILVVLAIVTVLAALVAKGLGSASEKAKEAGRLADLRQVGTAVLAFAAENNGQTPVAGGAIPVGGTDTQTGQAAWSEQIEPLLQGDRRIFSQTHRRDPGTGEYRLSYFLGGRAAYLAAQQEGLLPLFQPLRLARLQSPSRYVLVGEIRALAFNPYDADPDNYTQEPAFGASGSGKDAALFFADGHVSRHNRYDTSRITTTYEGTEPSFFHPAQ